MASISCVCAADIAVSKTSDSDLHEHGYIELVYISEGFGVHKSNGVFYAYQKGQLIIYQTGNFHADFASCPGVQFCIGLKGLAAEQLPEGTWNCSEESKKIISQLHTVMTEQQSKWKTMDMDLLAGALVFRLRRDLQQIPTSSPQTEKSDICEIARNEMDKNLENPYTLDQLCSKIFISKSYLRKLFRDKYGESPLAYLIRKKLEIAEERLIITDLPIHEIAEKIGFSNPFYFTTLFTKKIGMSPSAYREKFKKNPASSNRERNV